MSIFQLYKFYKNDGPTNYVNSQQCMQSSTFNWFFVVFNMHVVAEVVIFLNPVFLRITEVAGFTSSY